MKKNGFVSTSLIYTFFIIFLTLMLFLISNYSRVRYLLDEYKYDIKTSYAHNNEGDINIYILLWNTHTLEYEYRTDVPAFGYIFDENVSNCKNGSKISYEDGKVSVTASKKDSCYAYFNAIEEDINLKIYKKDNPLSSRVLVNDIPDNTYELTTKTCTEGNIDFDEATRQFIIETGSKTTCEVEFMKINNINQNVGDNENYTMMMENAFGIEGFTPDKKYIETNERPNELYNYVGFICDDANTTVINEGETFSKVGNGKCHLYFDIKGN